MKKSIELIFNLAYWTCYCLVGLLMYGTLTLGREIPHQPTILSAITGVVIVPALFSFYGMYFLVFKKYVQNNLWKKAALSGMANIGISTLAGAITMTMLLKPTAMIEGTWVDVLLKFALIAIIALINTIMAWVIVGFITWFKELDLKNQLLVRNKEMEMALLKSKLDPHFLFNSLNNIDALIISDPKKGSEFINKLSDIIRFMLYETQEPRIPLEKEIAFLKNYIELQSIRTSNKEFVQLIITGDIHQKQIAPNLFIPFVENAFKHCLNKKEKVAIEIGLNIESNSLTFTCKNKFDANKIVNENAMGNDLIQKRLEALYANNHSLDIKCKNDFYEVTLVVNG
ncbi:MAG: sensor histidine kinase [Salibacteraceae bacterium]